MTHSVTMLLLMATAAIAQTISLSSWERSISGTVTSAETGMPIVKRTVSVRGLNSGKEVAGETDMLGRYKVSHLLPGDFVVTVKGDDLVLSTANVTLTAEKDATGVDLAIATSSEISGTVMDHDKKPILSAPVMLIQKVYRYGQARYDQVALTTTDFQGHYRFQRVPPGGPYALLSRISPRAFGPISDEPAEMDQRLPAIMPAYYMNSRYPDGALTVSPNPGQKIEGLDIQIERVKAYCAEGVAQAEGKPAAMYLEIYDSGMVSSPKVPEIILRPVASAQRGGMFVFRTSNRVRTGTDGKFRICGLNPGEYHIWASSETPPARNQVSGAVSFRIFDKDLPNLRISALPPVSLHPEVIWDGDGAPEPADAKVYILPLHPAASGAVLSDDDYAVRAEPAGGYYIKDIVYGSVSVLHTVFQPRSGDGLKVVIGRDGGTVSAKVADSDGIPIKSASVWFLPSSATTAVELETVLLSCITDAAGVCAPPTLRPGKYSVLATMERLTHSAADIDKLWGARLKGTDVELAPAATAQVSLSPIAVF